MAPEPSPGPDFESEDAARPGRHPSPVEAFNGGEPTLDGAFSAGGVDLTFIRWMLERSPEERLQARTA